MKGMQRRTVSAILGTGLLIVAAVLYGFDAGGPRTAVDSRRGVDRRPGRTVGAGRRMAAALTAIRCAGVSFRFLTRYSTDSHHVAAKL